MYAIIQTGGKQIKVAKGDSILVEKLDVKEGETVTFDKVLLVGGETVKVGAPYVKGASVTATVEKQGKSKKIVVFKYKKGDSSNGDQDSSHRKSYLTLQSQTRKTF